MKKVHDVLSEVLSLAISMILVLGFWALGLYFANYNNVGIYGIIISSITFAVLIIFMIINFIGKAQLKKFAKNLNIKQTNEFGLKYKEKIEQDYLGSLAKLNKSFLGFKVYVITIFITILILSFGLGLAAIVFEWQIIVMILLIYLGWAIVFSIFGSKKVEMAKSELVLNKKDFPQIFSVLEKAKNNFNCKKEIHLAISDSIAINQYQNKIYIYIEPQMLKLLTIDEFYNVLLHEFSHLYNEDTIRSDKYNKFYNKVCESTQNAFVTLGRKLLLEYYTSKLMLKYELYRLIASRYHENEADKTILKFGDAQVYINATSKATLMCSYLESSNRFISFDVYVGEEPPKDIASIKLSMYKEFVEKNKDKLLFILNNELPARIDSHPTFKQRMESLGVTKFDYLTEERNEEFIKEQDKLLEMLNSFLYNAYKTDYDYYKENNYTLRLKEMNEYDEAIANKTELFLDKLVDYAGAFLGVDNIKAESIIDRVLVLNENLPHANFYKGILLFERYDIDCVQHFYKATENFNLCDSAMDYIGRIALKLGRQDILDEYRAKVVDLAQNAHDEVKNTYFNKNDKWDYSDLNADMQKDILNFIIKEKNEALINVYAIKKCTEMPVYVYILEFGGKDFALMQEFHGKLCHYLDLIANVDFAVYVINKSIKQKLKQLPNAKIFSDISPINN